MDSGARLPGFNFFFAGQSPDSSVPKFPPLHGWDINDAYLTGLLGVLMELIYIKP